MTYTPTGPLYCTLEEVTAALNLNAAGLNTDPVALAIDAACRQIEDHCSRPFTQDPLPRQDTGCTLGNTSFVADTSILATDVLRQVTDQNGLVPAGALVTYPVPGSGFTLATFDGVQLVPTETESDVTLTIGLAVRRFVSADPWLCQVDDISTTNGLIVKSDYAGDGTFGTIWEDADYQSEPINGIWQGISGWPITALRAIRDLYFPVWGGIAYPKPYTQALVEVAAQWGWAQVPANVHQAAIIQSIATYKAADVPFGATPFGEMGVLRMKQALHPTAELLLEPFAEDEVLVA